MHHSLYLSFFVLCYIGPNKDTPNVLMTQNNQAKPVDPSLIPNSDNAIRMYESYGGHITLWSDFGKDPLSDRRDLSNMREDKFFEQYPRFDEIFHTIVNNNGTLFHDGLLCFIDVSMQLAAQL